MDLREYLFKHKMTAAQFSKNINYNRNYICAIVRKYFKPGKKLCKLIIEATNGECTMERLMEIPCKTDLQTEMKFEGLE